MFSQVSGSGATGGKLRKDPLKLVILRSALLQRVDLVRFGWALSIKSDANFDPGAPEIRRVLPACDGLSECLNLERDHIPTRFGCRFFLSFGISDTRREK